VTYFIQTNCFREQFHRINGFIHRTQKIRGSLRWIHVVSDAARKREKLLAKSSYQFIWKAEGHPIFIFLSKFLRTKLQSCTGNLINLHFTTGNQFYYEAFSLINAIFANTLRQHVHSKIWIKQFLRPLQGLCTRASFFLVFPR